MILTNAQMFDSIQALRQATEEKGLLGYAVAVNLRKLSAIPEVLEFSRKRDELLAQHGQDAGGGSYTFTPEALQAFRAELQPFADLQTDVAVMQVAPDVFCGGNLTSGQMLTLYWMVKEE